MLMKVRDSRSVSPAYQIQRREIPEIALQSQQESLSRVENKFQESVLAELGKSPRLVTTPHRIAGPNPPFADFEEFAEQERIVFARPVHKALELIELKYGTRVLSPPYDGGWATGAGDPVAHWDGRAFAMATDGGSTSGFSLQLESPVRAFASIDFRGSYSYSWASLDDRPNLRASGGIGRCVYRGNDAQPTGVLRSTLYAVSGTRAFTGDKGAGDISHLVAGGPTHPFGTFASHLEPISILMEPDVQYSVWLWCWQAGSGMQGAPFLSFVSCDVPVVTIQTSEPVFPPVH
jgi:hypothetical protein